MQFDRNHPTPVTKCRRNNFDAQPGNWMYLVLNPWNQVRVEEWGTSFQLDGHSWRSCSALETVPLKTCCLTACWRSLISNTLSEITAVTLRCHQIDVSSLSRPTVYGSNWLCRCLRQSIICKAPVHLFWLSENCLRMLKKTTTFLSVTVILNLIFTRQFPTMFYFQFLPDSSALLCCDSCFIWEACNVYCRLLCLVVAPCITFMSGVNDA